MDYYVREYARHGLHGTLNWYRTHDINAKDAEEGLPQITQPTLYIAGLKDNVLLPSMAAGMRKSIPNLTTAEVDTSHWAMVQDPEGVNRILREWVGGVVFGEGGVEKGRL
ncbi:MAG: hypothetical protein M1828_000981 [Chrysothrix sp. TS-e1954]|nr:MAG: hypothetical protein M1828_000981 [Chrysothrix sp. TS-e1954]